MPLAVFAGAEWMVRHTVDQVPRWYAAASEMASRQPLGVLLVGNSRTRQAVPIPAFEEAAFRATGRRISAFNLGLGWSTATQHLLGLRNLFEERGESLRGSYVLVQANGAEMKRAWTTEQQPWLLNQMLRPSDLPAFWFSSGTMVSDKIHVTLRCAAQPFSLLRRRERFREFLLLTVAPGVAGGVADEVLPGQPHVPAGDDEADAAAARRDRMLRVAGKRSEWASPRLPPCERGILPEYADLVASHGAHLVFFEVPISSYVKRRYAEPCAGFQAWADGRGIPILRPTFEYTDDDLPDLSHLSARRAPAFAEALARSWAAAAGG